MKFMSAGVAAIGLVSAIALAPPTYAAGSYDGTWVVDVPSAGTISNTNNETCPALRIPIQIRDNRVTGSLQRVATTTGAVIVEPGNGRTSAPVTGTVAPDGTVNAEWQNYHAVGRLGPQMGQVTIQGECGPRVATALRIAPAPTEGQGSSTAPYTPNQSYGPVPPNPSR